MPVPWGHGCHTHCCKHTPSVGNSLLLQENQRLLSLLGIFSFTNSSMMLCAHGRIGMRSVLSPGPADNHSQEMCCSTDLRNVPLEGLQGQDYGTSHCPVVIPGKSKRDGHITILQHGQGPDCTSVQSCPGIGSHSYRRVSTGTNGQKRPLWDEAAGRTGHSLLVDHYHQVWVTDKPWILSKLLVGNHVFHELLWWDRGCVMPWEDRKDSRAADSPSPPTYHERSACCP